MHEHDVYRGQVLTIEVDALRAAEARRATVTDTDVASVLDELLAETSALTRVLLGADDPGQGASPHPHGWVSSFGRLGSE